MKTYCYDVEVFPNFFSVVFIDVDTDPKLIEAYEIADYTGNDTMKHRILKEYIKPYTFIICDVRNDLDLLIDFMTTHKLLVGFNNINYDDNILDAIIKYHRQFNKKLINKSTGDHFNKELYELSGDLIDYGTGWHYNQPKSKYYRKPYYSKDLQKLLYLDKLFVSLKQVAVQLRHYRIQDLPLPYNKPIDFADIYDILDYNVNDVIITYKLYHNQLDEINLRESITDLYGVNVRTESRSGTANRLMMYFYAKETGLDIKDFKNDRTDRRIIRYDEIISDKIEFISPELKDFLNNLKSKSIIVGAEQLKESVMFKNREYTFATGGLHSVDTCNIYKSSEKYTIRDADVRSFYPYIILNEGIYPEHLDKDIFLKILRMVTEERVKTKEYNKILSKSDEITDNVIKYRRLFDNKAEALKIVINATYGKLGDENSFLYDLKAMYQTTINGQLYLLMLIDMLAQIGVECISANTDGIICKVRPSEEKEYMNTCSHWEDKTDFNLEYTDYEKYVCYAVNDYMAIKKGYSESDKTDEDKKKYIKEKGLFVTTPQINKGYNKPIIAKALVHYFADGISVEDYIKSHTDIYDFCVSIKTGKDFIKEYHTLTEGDKIVYELQKNVRYYIANTIGVIMKRYATPKIDKRGVRREYIALHKGVNSIVFNDFKPYDNFEDYKINYAYYIKEAYDLLYKINNLDYSKMRKQSYGGLFKDLEDE